MSDPAPGADATGEDGTTTDAGVAAGPSGRRRRTVPAGAFVVVLMVAVALAVLAVVALADDGGGTASSDQDVRLAAGRFAERFLTYDRDGFDEWRAGVLELSTGGFAEEFDQAEDGLRVFFEEGGRDAVAQVTDVFVGQEDRGAIEAVVVYDREVVGTEDSFRESDRYLQLALLRIDGQWLVDNVVDLAASDPAAQPPAPAPTSTTSAADTAPEAPTTTAG